jgi:hypothetical protein
VGGMARYKEGKREKEGKKNRKEERHENRKEGGSNKQTIVRGVMK